MVYYCITHIAANTIATGNIADNAVDGTKIAQNSILTRHIDDAQITADQLAANSVSASELKSDALMDKTLLEMLLLILMY